MRHTLVVFSLVNWIQDFCLLRFVQHLKVYMSAWESIQKNYHLIPYFCYPKAEVIITSFFTV